ncbi:hypothetical protein BOTBODRAFT_187973 [Botryobasidium botryosum FD-172 SS1]|uniref:Mob1/phocein n=1 Tax=Botryobasidium botryosum (strain FD-172 SS1) TaxID=930990 RepID=A0A067MR95_BOTB1|nr:hypothetical protein BOTBODRAFT_187973 [Botryobasidium botryosum FD-172 SS1]
MAALAQPVPRITRGCRLQDAFPSPEEPPLLSSLDSAFQLQEYISLLIRLDVHDVQRIVNLPGKKEGPNASAGDAEKDHAKEGSGNSEDDRGVDEGCWIYEQLRRLAQDLTQPLITTLQMECTRSSCPEMKAGEWLYFCVAHGGGGGMEQCCAIDYIMHTLDSATALLNSPRVFPSRISIPQTSHRHFSSLARRLSRIFAHAYYHHREAFEQSEAETSLYARFLHLSQTFKLVPPEFLVIPMPSSATESAAPTADESSESILPARSLSPPPDGLGKQLNSRSRTDTMYLTAEMLELARSELEKEENEKLPVLMAAPDVDMKRDAMANGPLEDEEADSAVSDHAESAEADPVDVSKSFITEDEAEELPSTDSLPTIDTTADAETTDSSEPSVESTNELEPVLPESQPTDLDKEVADGAEELKEGHDASTEEQDLVEVEWEDEKEKSDEKTEAAPV